MFRRAAETRAHGVPGPAARQVGHPAPPDRPGPHLAIAPAGEVEWDGSERPEGVSGSAAEV